MTARAIFWHCYAFSLLAYLYADYIPSSNDCTVLVEQCQRHSACSKLWIHYQRNCPTRHQRCYMTSRQSCYEAFEYLRKTPLPKCKCHDNPLHRGFECHKLYIEINHNNCIEQIFNLRRPLKVHNFSHDYSSFQDNTLWSVKPPVFPQTVSNVQTVTRFPGYSRAQNVRRGQGVRNPAPNEKQNTGRTTYVPGHSAQTSESKEGESARERKRYNYGITESSISTRTDAAPRPEHFSSTQRPFVIGQGFGGQITPPQQRIRPTDNQKGINSPDKQRTHVIYQPKASIRPPNHRRPPNAIDSTRAAKQSDRSTPPTWVQVPAKIEGADIGLEVFATENSKQTTIYANQQSSQSSENKQKTADAIIDDTEQDKTYGAQTTTPQAQIQSSGYLTQDSRSEKTPKPTGKQGLIYRVSTTGPTTSTSTKSTTMKGETKTVKEEFFAVKDMGQVDASIDKAENEPVPEALQGSSVSTTNRNTVLQSTTVGTTTTEHQQQQEDVLEKVQSSDRGDHMINKHEHLSRTGPRLSTVALTTTAGLESEEEVEESFEGPDKPDNLITTMLTSSVLSSTTSELELVPEKVNPELGTFPVDRKNEKKAKPTARSPKQMRNTSVKINSETIEKDGETPEIKTRILLPTDLEPLDAEKLNGNQCDAPVVKNMKKRTIHVKEKEIFKINNATKTVTCTCIRSKLSCVETDPRDEVFKRCQRSGDRSVSHGWPWLDKDKGSCRCFDGQVVCEMPKEWRTFNDSAVYVVASYSTKPYSRAVRDLSKAGEVNQLPGYSDALQRDLNAFLLNETQNSNCKLVKSYDDVSAGSVAYKLWVNDDRRGWSTNPAPEACRDAVRQIVRKIQSGQFSDEVFTVSLIKYLSSYDITTSGSAAQLAMIRTMMIVILFYLL